MSDNLCVNVEALAYGNNLFCQFRADVYLHTVSHVEHLVHLFPVCVALFLYRLEEWRYREHVVFHDTTVVADKVKHFRLCSTRAVHHSVNFRTQFVKQFLDDRSVGAGRRENELSGIHIDAFHLVVQTACTAVNQFFRDCVVVAFRVLLCQILCEHIVAGTCKTVASHASVV